MAAPSHRIDAIYPPKGLPNKALLSQARQLLQCSLLTLADVHINPLPLVEKIVCTHGTCEAHWNGC